MSKPQRPKVRIRFTYNKETGQIEDFIIDDNAESASEDYHDNIAEQISSRLGANPDIEDAGPIRLNRSMQERIERGNQKNAEEEADSETA